MLEAWHRTTHTINKQLIEQISLIPVIYELFDEEIEDIKNDIVNLELKSENQEAVLSFVIEFRKLQGKKEAYEELASFFSQVRADAAAKQAE